MPRNSGGVYSPPTGTYGISGTPISSSAYDTFINDLSTELTNSLNVQGTAPMLAALNMGTFPINNAATPVNPTDVVIKSYVDNSIPAGMIAGYAIFSTPTGWLYCNGASLSTATYARLFASIGYAYGGSGANFNLPDFRGCFLRGFDNGRGLDFQGSRAAHAFQASYLVNHFHTVTDPTHAHGVYDPSHTHAAVTGGHSHSVSDPTHNHSQSPHAHGVSDPGHSHTGITRQVGSGGWFSLGSLSPEIAAGNTDVAYTGIGIQAQYANINGAGTGISIVAVGNIGVSVSGAYTGIGIYGAYTGIAVSSVSTGNVNSAATETTVVNYPILWCIKY